MSDGPDQRNDDVQLKQDHGLGPRLAESQPENDNQLNDTFDSFTYAGITLYDKRFIKKGCVCVMLAVTMQCKMGIFH